MRLQVTTNDKREIRWFLVSYTFENALYLAEVHEIDMPGWTLFECYMLPSKEVIYLAWNANTETPEWKAVNGGNLPMHVPGLSNAILNKKREIDLAMM